MRRRLQTMEWGWVFALLLPLIGILPTLSDGIANGADAPFHMHRIFAMGEFFEQGNLYPRWVPYFHMGYGYPIFNYYAPGASYLGGILAWAGIHATTAYNLVNALAWMLGSAGVYALARLWMPSRLAILGCALWVFAPSRFFEFWWQGSLAQIVASSFIPWTFYSLIKTVREPKAIHSLSIAVSLSGIALSHTPMTYITSLFIAPMVLVVPLFQSRKTIIKTYSYLIGGLVLGGGLSAIFLLPAVLELPYVQISGGLASTVDYLESKFLQPWELFQFPQLIDRTDLFVDMPRTLGLVGGVLSLLGVIALVWKRHVRLALGLAVGLGFVIFMTVSASVDIWLAIPQFQNLRFPERFLRVGTVFIAILGASSLWLIPMRWRMVGLVGMLSLVILQAMPLVQPHEDFKRWENLSAKDEILMEHNENNWGTTAYNEFEPIWGEHVPFGLPPDLTLYEESPLAVRLLESDLVNFADNLQATQIDYSTVQVTLGSPQTIRFRQFYFPGWEVMVNDKPVEPYAEEAQGLLTLDLPAGESTVAVWYNGTTLQWIATFITLASIGVSIVILYRHWRQPNTKSETSTHIGLTWTYGISISVGIVIFAIINQTILLPSGIFHHESPADEPIYLHTRTEVDFGETISLLGYTLNQDAISASAPLQITLYWYSDTPIHNDLFSLVQLVDLPVSEAWAISSSITPIEVSPERFRSDIHLLELKEDAPPYVGRISVQMVNRATDEPLFLGDGSDRLLLEPIIQIHGQTDTSRQVLNYQLGGSIELNCASVTAHDERYQIDLFWHVIGNIERDWVVLVHGLDSEGNIIEQNDKAPLNNQYPTFFWQSGQTLQDTHSLSLNEELSHVALGLYTRENLARMPITQNSEPVPDSRIVLPLWDETCQT